MPHPTIELDCNPISALGLRERGHLSGSTFVTESFSAMGMLADYVLPTAKTAVFGFLIGTLSCYLGYNATQGAAGVGRASTRSVVFSSLLVILSDAVLVKAILIGFPGMTNDPQPESARQSFAVEIEHVGIMPLGERPPAKTGRKQWNGLCLVLVEWKK